MKTTKTPWQKLLDFAWDKSRAEHLLLLSEWNHELSLWENQREKLKKDWEMSFPSFGEIAPSFRITTNPIISLLSIKSARRKLKYLSTKTYIKMKKEAQKNWLDKIILAAPENCQLVVIKTSYTPSENNKKIFDDCVKNREHAEICYVGCICVFWVAFTPQEKVDCTYWAMNKYNSTVEYII